MSSILSRFRRHGQFICIVALPFTARYLNPMAAFAREIQLYKYYIDESGFGNREIMDQKVYEEKKKAPARLVLLITRDTWYIVSAQLIGYVCCRIPYFFSTSKDLPGKFMLSYMPRDRTVHEFVTVTHEGLRFRGQLFPTLNSMIKWFKEHFRDPIPQRIVTPSHATPSQLSSQSIRVGVLLLLSPLFYQLFTRDRLSEAIFIPTGCYSCLQHITRCSIRCQFSKQLHTLRLQSQFQSVVWNLWLSIFSFRRRKWRQLSWLHPTTHRRRLRLRRTVRRRVKDRPTPQPALLLLPGPHPLVALCPAVAPRLVVVLRLVVASRLAVASHHEEVSLQEEAWPQEEAWHLVVTRHQDKPTWLPDTVRPPVGCEFPTVESSSR